MTDAVVGELLVCLLLVLFPHVHSVDKDRISQLVDNFLLVICAHCTFQAVEVQRQLCAEVTKNVHLPFCVKLLFLSLYMVEVPEISVFSIDHLLVSLESFDSTLLKDHNPVIILKYVIRVVEQNHQLPLLCLFLAQNLLQKIFIACIQWLEHFVHQVNFSFRAQNTCKRDFMQLD